MLKALTGNRILKGSLGFGSDRELKSRSKGDASFISYRDRDRDSGVGT
jgi:hypothetical protein